MASLTQPTQFQCDMFPDGVAIVDAAISLWLQEHWITPVFIKLIQTYKVAVPKELATHTEFMAHPVSLGKYMYDMHIAPKLSKFVISEKQDGVRFWLCFGHDHDFNKIAFMMNRNGQKWIVPVEAPDDMYRGTLLDGEWMEHHSEYDPELGQIVKRYTYIVFDVLSYGGVKQIQYCPFDERLYAVHRIVDQCRWGDRVEFKTKTWMTLADFAATQGRMDDDRSINMDILRRMHQNADAGTLGLCKRQLRQDGHILMHRENPACQLATAPPFIFKLKHTHTIDLWLILVRDTIENHERTWLLELHDDRSIKLTENMEEYLSRRRSSLEAPYDWMTVRDINIMIRSWCHHKTLPNGQNITYRISLQPNSTSAETLLEMFLHHPTRRPLIEFKVERAEPSMHDKSMVIGEIALMHQRDDKNRANHADIICRTMDHMMIDDRLTLDDIMHHANPSFAHSSSMV